SGRRGGSMTGRRGEQDGQDGQDGQGFGCGNSWPSLPISPRLLVSLSPGHPVTVRLGQQRGEAGGPFLVAGFGDGAGDRGLVAEDDDGPAGAGEGGVEEVAGE